LKTFRAFEKSVGNKPLFTREVLERTATDVAKVRNKVTRKQQIVVPHVLGGAQRLIWSGNESCTPRLAWVNSWALAERQGKAPLYRFSFGSSTSGVAERYNLRPNDRATSLRRLKVVCEPAPVVMLDQMAELQSRILKHKVWTTMTKLLVDLPVKVDNVVCLALGFPYLQPRTCAQHMLAVCMADFLAAHYGSSDALPILAFDPTHTLEDMCNCVSSVNWMLRINACITICCRVMMFVYRSSQLRGKCTCPPGSACYNKISCDLAHVVTT
jgi:hypothetical protein